jgi:kynurenine formamidase
MSTYIDLTAVLHDGQQGHWGDPGVQITAHTQFAEDGYRLSALALGSHSGTHIDSPAHILEGGNTLDQIQIDRFFATAFVLDCRGCSAVDVPLLENIPHSCDGLLICGTECYLTIAAAEQLVERGIRLVGFESLSCDRLDSPDLPVHRILLASEILIIEHVVNLETIIGSTVALYALPLLFAHSDGAPARVVARVISSR